ncbi:hypothetical protein GPECTOR_65g208 [Gonium pectorale]|uniref:Uncharacterized protein n=1 Tax=Gonium pectorale TaxID=33097 RepID=A0A150G5I9_GONPE|nr:hypothetical protein GPECTOR_65g208 [Gonium pectorale]|eukprot:KXZ44590.1 hypothetical protein GPECTOR_65g208 [Gonium pectorale]
MLSYTLEPDEGLARAGVELLLSRGARVDVPCRLGPELLGTGGEGEVGGEGEGERDGHGGVSITPLLAAFMPFQRDTSLAVSSRP